MQIGGVLASGERQDGRSPDYDDWSLNGDLIVYYPVLDIALELLHGYPRQRRCSPRSVKGMRMPVPREASLPEIHSERQAGGYSSLYFPKAEDAGFILDLDYSLQRQTNEEIELEVISDTEIRGRKKTVYWAFDQYINFYAKFSKPFTYTLVKGLERLGIEINVLVEGWCRKPNIPSYYARGISGVADYFPALFLHSFWHCRL